MDLHFCTQELILPDHCMSALTTQSLCMPIYVWGIYLELTADLSAVLFLQAFRWFTSQRGLPATILSDNAKTFKSASSDINYENKSTW